MTVTENLNQASFLAMKFPILETRAYTNQRGDVISIWHFEAGAEGRLLDFIQDRTDEAKIIKAYLGARYQLISKTKEK